MSAFVVERLDAAVHAARQGRRARAADHAKIAGPAQPRSPPAPPDRVGRAPSKTMDIERINAIGKSIADLSERTAALRGYL